jgi:hypothetical protein
VNAPPLGDAAHLREGLARSGLARIDLWVAVVGVGGSFTVRELDSILSGEVQATAMEHDWIAAALNDHFTGLGQDHPIRYSGQGPPAA